MNETYEEIKKSDDSFDIMALSKYHPLVFRFKGYHKQPAKKIVVCVKDVLKYFPKTLLHLMGFVQKSGWGKTRVIMTEEGEFNYMEKYIPVPFHEFQAFMSFKKYGFTSNIKDAYEFVTKFGGDKKVEKAYKKYLFIINIKKEKYFNPLNPEQDLCERFVWRAVQIFHMEKYDKDPDFYDWTATSPVTGNTSVFWMRCLNKKKNNCKVMEQAKKNEIMNMTMLNDSDSDSDSDSDTSFNDSPHC